MYKYVRLVQVGNGLEPDTVQVGRQFKLVASSNPTGGALVV